MTFRLASDSGSVTENASRTSNVLANDTSAVRVTQVKAGSGAYSPVTSAGTIIEGTYGVLTISSSGAYTYTASKADALAKGKTASDTFTYSAASSSGTTATTTLKITVTGANDAPVITAPAFALNTINENQIANTGQTVTSIGRSSDVDNGALHGMAITSLVSGNGQWQYSINAGTSWANVGPVSDTSALLLRATDLIRFNPNGIDGTDASFTYRAWDQTSGPTGTKVNPGVGGGITAYSAASSTATIAVASVNDAPVAQAASATGDEDGPPITGQLHASDIDSTRLSYSLVADSSVGGTTAIDPDTGAYSFVPNANFSGAASFKFIASDGSANSAAAVAITIVPINDPPVAVNDTASTPQDISVLVNVLANDSDPENDILSLAKVEGSTHGTVAIENGQVRYVPNAGFVGSDGFIYTIADTNGATAIANGTVAVLANAGPVTIVLDQDYGYGQYRVTALPAHSIIDATTASWIVDNSRNDNPTAANPSTSGTGPVSTYPFRVDSAGRGLMIEGGTIWGQVPQDSDWDYTYTNSAAIRVAASPDVIIDHWRIDKAWDAIRIANGTSGFLIDDAYVTNNRDDAVEDDYVMGGTIRDSLFDGTFSGISIGDGDHWDGSMNTITLESVFMRNKPYLFHGALTHVSPIKTDTGMPSTTPDIRIIDSVFAIEDPNHGSQARLQLAWENLVESHGNVFLNLSDAPLPATYPALPSGFTLLQGQVARDYWEAARTAWLDNHDGVDDVPLTPLPPIPDPIPSDILTR